MSVGQSVPDAWHRFRGEPLPAPAGEASPPGGTRRRSVAVHDLAEVGRRPHHHDHRGGGAPSLRPRRAGAGPRGQGGPESPTTFAPGGRPRYGPTPRRPFGWRRVSGVPGEPVLSRALAWFAETRLPGRMHGAPVSATHGGTPVGHISRDSTAVVGRERPAPERKPGRRRP